MFAGLLLVFVRIYFLVSSANPLTPLICTVYANSCSFTAKLIAPQSVCQKYAEEDALYTIYGSDVRNAHIFFIQG